MYERARMLGGGTVFCLAILAGSASCDGLGNGGSGGNAGNGGDGGNGTPSTYCTNTPPGYDPILEKDIPADHPDAIPTYYSDVTLPGGCIHRFANAFQVRSGAKVTIEAGAVIEIGGGGSSNEIFVSEGTLVAEGTAAAPVEFRPAEGSTFGGIYVNDTGTTSLRHAYIHDVTHSLQTGGPDGACLTIYGNADTVPQGIVIEDSKFERCAYGGIRFGTSLEDESPPSAIAGMYASFARNEISECEYGFVVHNESLIAGIKEMPKTTGVKAHVTDNISIKNTDLTFLDGGIPWQGTAMTVYSGAKLRFAPGVVFEVQVGFNEAPYFRVSGDGELFMEGTADKPIVVSVDPGLSGGQAVAYSVKGTLRHVQFKGADLIEIGPETSVENVIHENCAGNEKTAFVFSGDGPTFASNTIRNCPIGIRAYQQAIYRAGAGNVYETVDHNQLDVSSTKVGTATWTGQSVPWIFGDIYITGTLTLGPGVHLTGQEAASDALIQVSAGAKIIAQGTAEQPVRFDSRGTGANSWDGIQLLDTATVDFTYVDMSEAWTGVYTDNAPITITNSTFHDNATDVMTGCGPATVTNSMVTVKKEANCP